MSDENGMTAATLRAIELAGGPAALADQIGASRQLVAYWKRAGRIGPKWVLKVEEAIQARVTRYQLRPDVYGS